MVTDSKRLQQVLKNLLSNAFKFTEHGGVRLSVSLAETGWSTDHPILSSAASVVSFEVADTGIGIPFEKQRIIFEAFQQADAGTSRKYGGTGLGLAISRELASLLGGEIQLRSAPGAGSTFTLYLPLTYVGPSATAAPAAEKKTSASTPLASVSVVEHPSERLEDDRDSLQPEDTVLLIIEDDPHYAQVLRDLSRDKGFKTLVAMRGAEGLALAREFDPTAISLDVFLPDMLGVDGAQSLEAGSEQLATSRFKCSRSMKTGITVWRAAAFAFVTKPTTPEGLDAALGANQRVFDVRAANGLLVVEDNPAEQLSIRELLGLRRR